MAKKKEEIIEEETPKDAVWPTRKHTDSDDPLPRSSRLPKPIAVLLGFAVFILFGWLMYSYGYDPIMDRLATPTPTPTQVPIPTVTPVLSEINKYEAWCTELILGRPYDPVTDEEALTEEERESVAYCETNFGSEDDIVCKPSDTITFTELGKIVTGEVIESENEILTDPSSVVLTDGRVRIYYHSTENGIVSAISNEPVSESSTTASFEVQITSVTPRYTNPEVVLLSDSTYRMFALYENEIYSFFSTDAITFEVEGVRVGISDLDIDGIVDFDIVSLEEGYRMYVKAELAGGNDIVTAFSSDLMTWEREEGSLESVSDTASFNFSEKMKYYAVSKIGNLYCTSSSEDGKVFNLQGMFSEVTLFPDHLLESELDIAQISEGFFLILSSDNTSETESYLSAGILQVAQ